MKRKCLRTRMVWTLAVLLSFIAPTAAVGAEPFPTKSIEMLVAYRAGGLVDSMARALAQKMEEILGQPVVVINKEGAGGAIALTALKNAKKDGYTIGATTASSIAFTPLMQSVGYTLQDYQYLA